MTWMLLESNELTVLTVNCCISTFVNTHVLGREDSDKAAVILESDAHLCEHCLTTRHITSVNV